MTPWLWKSLVQIALKEDIGVGDITTELTISGDQIGQMDLVCRQSAVICGLDAVVEAYRQLDRRVEIELLVEDGDYLQAGAVMARVRGPVRSLLTGERTSLNIVQWLSGIATATREVVDRLKGLDVAVLDTRKTTPGWRAFEKYAVRMGGGKNHRQGLYDAVLIKDNHVAAVGSIGEAVRRVKESVGHTVFVEVEVDSLSQLPEVLAEHPDGILLDNMSLDDIREAVHVIHGRAFVEASGGIRLDQVREIAQTGIDAVSMGWLTQSAPAVDIGADWRP